MRDGAPGTHPPLHIGMLEPHLRCYGGIRRMVEFANRLSDRGHAVTFYLPDGEKLGCDWMPCRASVKRIRDGREDPLDVLLFNHEPQWFLLSAFRRARARVFYALHYAKLYEKPGSWESLRANVDAVLANSQWTAAMIEREMGVRPPVVLGGLSREYFHPVHVDKRYPILCAGDERPWKGTEVIERAARLLGVPLERYSGKNLPQAKMAEEYGRAEVFVVGSTVEGFGWPGLEALACGVPLVTTDNGGCSEYAIDGETAVVVPPGHPDEMADAISRLRADPLLARRLAQRGSALVRAKFDWEAAIGHLETELYAVVARGLSVEIPWRPRGTFERVAYAARTHYARAAWRGCLKAHRTAERPSTA